MDKFDRIQQLHRLFKTKRNPTTSVELAQQLECSPKTVMRTIDQMRDFLNAPIAYDRAQHGYQYQGDLAAMFELPGIWLTADELQSLTALLHLINSMGSSLLKDELSSVERQIKKLLTARGISVDDFEQKVKFITLGNRTLDSQIFSRISEALLSGKQLNIRYSNYARAASTRTISPQTLLYYRENWYIDAWCHLRKALRTFSISRIEKAALTHSPPTGSLPYRQLRKQDQSCHQLHQCSLPYRQLRNNW